MTPAQPFFGNRHSRAVATVMATAAFAAVLTLLPTAAWASLDPALQMALGNPDGAKADPGSRQHYLIQRPEYALSYNDDFRFPNWVGWHLSRQDIGDIERGQFKPDQTLPDGFTIVTPADYNRSGYDRGHNCPSKDRTRTRKDNDSVFLMTNMTPQAHGLNAGPWEKLESYARDLAIQEKDDLFIYCGHGFTAPKHRSIGKAQVAVPDFGWKIVVVVPPGAGPAVRRITATTRVIAVRMPNINTISRKDWREYRVSVADIEQATGFRFFDALPASIAAQLKNRVDFDQSAPSRREKVEPIAGAPAAVPGDVPSAAPAPAGAMAAKVWVNTRSGAYWRPGTRYYGKTKEGKYLSEADAIKAGYHPAEGQ